MIKFSCLRYKFKLQFEDVENIIYNVSVMDLFYEKIVGITENTAYRSVLIRHNDELYNMLTQGYEENIKIAAQSGYFKSIIALFNTNTIYRGKITILDMLFPTEKFMRKCRKYEVNPVLERVKINLHPFEVKYEVLNVHDKKKNHVAAIIVHWKIPNGSDSDSDSDDTSEVVNATDILNDSEVLDLQGVPSAVGTVGVVGAVGAMGAYQE